jgi:cell division protein FtsW
VTFQTSTLAAMVLFIFVARYLSKTRTVPITLSPPFGSSGCLYLLRYYLFFPQISHNGINFSMVMLVFIGKYPLRYIGIVVGSGIVFLTFFILIAKAFPDAFPNRVDTWISRIDNFTSDKPDEDDYQIEKAKIAIASGKIYGLGPGKSVQKNFYHNLLLILFCHHR